MWLGLKKDLAVFEFARGITDVPQQDPGSDAFASVPRHTKEIQVQPQLSGS